MQDGKLGMDGWLNRMMRKSSVIVLGALVLALTAGKAFSTQSSGTWICGSGSWTDQSCWNLIGFDPNDPNPLSLDEMVVASLTSTDEIDRTILRSLADNPDPLSPTFPYETTVDATGTGTMTLVHSAGVVGTFNGANHNIGVSGTGTLIQTGGRIIDNVILGKNAGSSGTYNLVDGYSGIAEGMLLVGVGGNGEVNQSGGTAAYYQMAVAVEEGSTGTYNLSGGRLRMGYNAYADISWIGKSGSGVFNQSGGYHGAASGMIIGATQTGHGIYNLSGGVVDEDSYLIVGDEGTGVFVQTGGVVEIGGMYNDLRGNGGGYIGNGAGSNGTYTLHDGTLTTSGGKIDVTVGNAGTGVFNQTGGTFDITACSNPYGCNLPAGNLKIASQAGSSGVYNLTGGASTSDSVKVGIGGHGAFNQSGGTHTVKGALSVADDSQAGVGVYSLSGGSLDAQQIVVNGNGTFNFNGGDITTDLFTNGGTLALNNTAATTAIDGNFFQLPAGILELAASYSLPGGVAANSSLGVTQTATLAGTLDLSLDLDLGAYTITNGKVDGLDLALLQFDVISADTILGEFDGLDLPDLGALDPFYDWQVSYVLNDFDTDYVRVSMVSTGNTAVPEPSTLLLMLSGLAGIGFSRRGKRAA